MKYTLCMAETESKKRERGGERPGRVMGICMGDDETCRGTVLIYARFVDHGY